MKGILSMSDKSKDDTVSSEDTTDLPPVLSRTVALTEIQRDPALRVRVALSRERIAEFQAVMSNKDTQPLPPMECTEVGGELFLSDGWHRYEAHTALKHKTVEVRVRKGSKADAFRAACMADRYCALPRTKADKNRAVTLALGMNLWRDRFIADMLAVSPNFVGQVRKRIQVDTPADNTPKIGRDGKLHPPKTDEQKRKPANTKPTPAPPQSIKPTIEAVAARFPGSTEAGWAGKVTLPNGSEHLTKTPFFPKKADAEADAEVLAGELTREPVPSSVEPAPSKLVKFILSFGKIGNTAIGIGSDDCVFRNDGNRAYVCDLPGYVEEWLECLNCNDQIVLTDLMSQAESVITALREKVVRPMLQAAE
jgi:hypothetical protein